MFEKIFELINKILYIYIYIFSSTFNVKQEECKFKNTYN